jgi:Ohr subfamily peroxiredoxin
LTVRSRIGGDNDQINEEGLIMTKLEKILYTARAHTTGGRDAGFSRSDDGHLGVRLSTPGGPGAGTNPEQLFAAGWSACFLSAIKLLAGKKRITLPTDAAIDAEVDLGMAHGVHGLAARLKVLLPGLDRQVAEELVQEAHHVCPYSIATQGNIEVVTTVVTEAAHVQSAHTSPGQPS